MGFASVVGDVAELVMQGTMAAGGSSAKTVMSVFTYRLASIGGAVSAGGLESAFNSGPTVDMLAAFNSRYTQVANLVRGLNDANDAYVSISRTGAGAIGTDGFPTSAAVSMLLRTSKRGRSYKGAKHFPAVSEADTTDDILTGTGLANWQAVRDAIALPLVDANGNTWNPCVVSRKLSQLMSNPTIVVANDVTSVLLNLNVGTMRHRRVKTVR